jgi:hypothetical protein
MVCGMLEANGIRSTYDKGGLPMSTYVLPWSAARTAFVGPQEILVQKSDFERARQLLEEARTS